MVCAGRRRRRVVRVYHIYHVTWVPNHGRVAASYKTAAHVYLPTLFQLLTFDLQ